MKSKFTRLTAALALLVGLAIPLGMWGQAPVGTTLWAEDFSGYSKDDVPSGEVSSNHTGTTVYNGGSVTYTCVNGGSTTKIYDETTAGGTSPELLVSKKSNSNVSGSFTIEGIPTGDATELTLTYKTNNTNNTVSSPTTGVEVAISTSKASMTRTWTITTGGASTITLVVTNSASSNTRVDDFSLVVKTAGGGSTLEDNDLTLNPTSLSLDLNANANNHTGTIAYTTSSTGAISVSESDYVTTEVNETNNTITVTPTAVTTSEQTITVTQAADATYAAGSATFIVTVANTTPTVTVTYHANDGTGDDVEETPYQGSDYIVATNTFSYTNHSFTKWHTNEAGTGGTDYNPGDVIEGISADLDLYAQWEEVNEVVDYLDRAFTGIEGTSYGNWSGKTGASGAVYAGNSAGGNDAIQLRTNGSASGIISTTSAGKVTKVEVQWNSNTSAGRKINIYGSNTAYTEASQLHNATTAGTLLGTIDYGSTTELTITGNYAYIGIRAVGGALYLDWVKITWATSGTPTPSISANNVDIAYDAVSGAIPYTINNPVDNATVVATTTDSWLTPGTAENGSVPFTCSANTETTARTATVTLSYVSGEETLDSKSVTVTQAAAPVIYTTIPALFDAATSTETNVLVTFDNWVVSGVSTNGKNVFVTDNNGNGFVIFDNNGGLGNTYTAGDILTGTAVSCTLKKYNGFAELLNVDATDLTITAGGTIAIANVAMADLAGVNTGALVHYDNLTCSIDNNKYYLSDGTTTLQVYNALYAFDALTAGTSYNITGVYQQYNSTKEILPRSVNDIEEVAVPSISLEEYSIETIADAFSGYYEVTYANLDIQSVSDFSVVFCDAEGTPLPDNPEWIITASVVVRDGLEGYWLEIATSANQGEARTARLKVCASSVCSDVCTISQAAYVAPVPSITITPATLNVPAADYTIANDFPITYEHIVVNNYQSFGIQFYNANNEELQEDPDWLIIQVAGSNAEGYKVIGYIAANTATEARNAYFKVYALDAGDNLVYSNLVTINQAKYVVDYATLPFEWEGGMPSAFEELNGTTLSGVGSYPNQATYQIKLDSDGDYIQVKTDSQPGKVTIGVKMIGGAVTSTITVQGSSDGETFTDIEELTIAGSQNSIHNLETVNEFGENDRYVRLYFTKGSNVGVGPIEIRKAHEPIVTITPAIVEVDDGEHDGYLTVAYENIVVTDTDNFDVYYYAADGTTTADYSEWFTAEVEQDATTGEYSVYYIVQDNPGQARTAYFRVYVLDDNGIEVYSNLIAVSQIEHFNPVMYTKASSIVSGQHYIIVGYKDEQVFAMGAQRSNNRGGVVISEDGTTATVTTADVHEFVISGTTTADFYSIFDERDNGYLCTAGGGNYLRTETSLGVNSEWNISFEETGEANVIASNSNNNNVMRFNYNNGTTIFACYESASQNPVYLYVRSDETPATYTLSINGYGDSEGGYYLIASPINNINPASVRGMTAGDYDLYYFNQTEADEWRNYEAVHFNMASGKGYLYAHKTDVTLNFTGMPYNGDGTVALVKDNNAGFAGWNLVGNPFGNAATLGNTAFYKMNSTGSELETATVGSTIAAMEGVFVVADTDGETVTFTEQTNPDNNQVSQFSISVSMNRGESIDRAIVRFDNGNQLPKFQLNPNHTKVYFPQGENDYAIVRSANEGEMPVSFKAENNGTYTLSVNAENMEMNYLHLIDNLTGADIDLLVNPSYSFEAKTTDYASRFRLVFNANTVNENSNETFAYYNGSEWVISNMGEATLQVVDMMGRVLSTETVSGNATMNTNSLSAGIYMMRLVKGEDVKVQKIVVR